MAAPATVRAGLLRQASGFWASPCACRALMATDQTADTPGSRSARPMPASKVEHAEILLSQPPPPDPMGPPVHRRRAARAHKKQPPSQSRARSPRRDPSAPVITAKGHSGHGKSRFREPPCSSRKTLPDTSIHLRHCRETPLVTPPQKASVNRQQSREPNKCQPPAHLHWSSAPTGNFWSAPAHR